MLRTHEETPKDRIALGTKLGAWEVKERLPSQQATVGETGSFFSRGYIVENSEGKHAFLKAMDYKTAMVLYQSLTPADAMLQIATDIAFEKKVATHCRKMSRVITALDEFTLETGSLDQRVECLIFEKADGHIRKFLDFSKELDVIFILKALHNSCVGLNQLHNNDMAHEDVKPSNIMIMNGEEKHSAKIGDLGRIVVKDPSKLGLSKTPAHFSNAFPGDGNYAPPEAMYRAQLDLDEFKHRVMCDLFQFGSLVYFCFVNVTMPAALFHYTHVDHKPANKSYNEAIPYLHSALSEALKDLEIAAPQYLKDELVQIVRELCNPDYRLRGHPGDIRGKHISPSLHRYHSILNRLLRKATIQIERIS
ncbi:protein kinase [Pseudomonadota bacterium]